MRVNVKQIVLVLLALAAASCSGYSKLIKSEDRELQYKTALEYYDQGKYFRAGTLLSIVASVFAGTEREDTIAYYYGASLYKDGNFEGSTETFEQFRRYFTRSPFLEDVEYMYAKGFYYSSPAVERDQASTHRALMAIQEYLGRYPNSTKKEGLLENITELQYKIYDKALMGARLYYDIGYYNSAVVALRNAIEQYPESNHRELLTYLIVASHYKYALNSVEEKKRQRFLNMQDAYYSFISEYPESEHRKEVDKMQAEAKKQLERFTEKDKNKHIEPKNGNQEE